eukprot:1360383-Amphidinium_carterae.1
MAVVDEDREKVLEIVVDVILYGWGIWSHLRNFISLPHHSLIGSDWSACDGDFWQQTVLHDKWQKQGRTDFMSAKDFVKCVLAIVTIL